MCQQTKELYFFLDSIEGIKQQQTFCSVLEL